MIEKSLNKVKQNKITERIANNIKIKTFFYAIII